jgi:exodeoxyribonuclease VII small subunit
MVNSKQRLSSGVFMTEKKIEEMNYEEAFSELEAIVDKLENEQSALAESMSLFERGQDLSKRCALLLEEAELKVKQLSGGELTDE